MRLLLFTDMTLSALNSPDGDVEVVDVGGGDSKKLEFDSGLKHYLHTLLL